MARHRFVALSVLIAQLFLGVAWIRSGVAHILEPTWWSGEQIASFVDQSSETGLPVYAFLAELIISPLERVLTVVVVVVQLVLGLFLLGNVQARITAMVSMFLSSNFIMGGEVNPSVFYMVMALVVLFRSVDEKPSKLSWRTFSRQATTLFVLVVLLCGPFVQTMRPGGVIEDPAIVLISMAGIFASACWAVYLRLSWPVLAGTAEALDLSSPEETEVDAEDVENMVDVEDDADHVVVDDVEHCHQVVADTGVVTSIDRHGSEPLSTVRAAALDGTPGGDGDWFSVRCHFLLAVETDSNTYEERITIWAAVEFKRALELAEQEARAYAVDRGAQYLESCDGYRMATPVLKGEPGQEIYSLIRTSSLAPAAYLRQFFFTGTEHSLYA